MSPTAVSPTVSSPTAPKAGAVVDGLTLVPGTQSRQYHSKEESIYALPADGAEYDRLEQQHRLLMLLFNGPVVAPVADVLKAGGKVVDVGCGPGSWIKEVKRAFPTAQCVATDFADTFKPNGEDIPFTHGDILKGLPFADGEFDFVHMRFFTGALKIEEWPLAAKELARITKPGGWVQMTEPDGELRSTRGVTAVIQDWNTRGFRGSLAKRGGEPLAGLKLVQFLSAAGMDSAQDHAASAPMNSAAGATGAHMVKDYAALVTTLAPILAQSWDMTAKEVEEWGARVLAECERLEGFHDFHTAVAQKPL